MTLNLKNEMSKYARLTQESGFLLGMLVRSYAPDREISVINMT